MDSLIAGRLRVLVRQTEECWPAKPSAVAPPPASRACGRERLTPLEAAHARDVAVTRRGAA